MWRRRSWQDARLRLRLRECSCCSPWAKLGYIFCRRSPYNVVDDITLQAVGTVETVEKELTKAITAFASGCNELDLIFEGPMTKILF